MTKDRLEILLLEYKTGAMAEADAAYAELMEAIDEGGLDEAVREEILVSFRLRGTNELWTEIRADKVWEKISPAITSIGAGGKTVGEGTIDEVAENGEEEDICSGRPVRILTRWWAAAAVLLVLGIGSYFWSQRKAVMPVAEKTNQPVNDALPGGNRAILTLAGGQRVVLDSAADGMLAKQGDVQVQKKGSGQLAYLSRGERSTTVLYNTLSTPRGGQYQLILPDGTKVWLNAASSITYPTVFTGPDRMVTMTGEAYFEVAKDMAHPFRVRVPVSGKDNKADGSLMDIAVLGTSFNIKAYPDEELARTTLVEGSVAVAAHGMSRVIKPGEQTAVGFTGVGIGVVAHADVSQVLAWKNGLFSFSHTDLPSVLRELGRWYDLDVVYEGKAPGWQFGGEITRNTNASQVLKILEESNVHCTIDGRKLIVLP